MYKAHQRSVDSLHRRRHDFKSIQSPKESHCATYLCQSHQQRYLRA